MPPAYAPAWRPSWTGRICWPTTSSSSRTTPASTSVTCVAPQRPWAWGGPSPACWTRWRWPARPGPAATCPTTSWGRWPPSWAPRPVPRTERWMTRAPPWTCCTRPWRSWRRSASRTWRTWPPPPTRSRPGAAPRAAWPTPCPAAPASTSSVRRPTRCSTWAAPWTSDAGCAPTSPPRRNAARWRRCWTPP